MDQLDDAIEDPNCREQVRQNLQWYIESCTNSLNSEPNDTLSSKEDLVSPGEVLH